MPARFIGALSSFLDSLDAGMTSKFAPGYLQPTIASRNPALDMDVYGAARGRQVAIRHFLREEPALSASDPVIHDAKLSVEVASMHCDRLLSLETNASISP